MVIVLRILGQDRSGERQRLTAYRSRSATRGRAIAQSLYPAARIKSPPFPHRADIDAQVPANVLRPLALQRLQDRTRPIRLAPLGRACQPTKDQSVRLCRVNW
jgi:hypothetical protein